MESKGVIFEGKTLDDAVRKGLEALGLARAEVMIQVMEEGSGGFLGLGSRPYKVRMMPRPRREVRERPERGDRGGRRDERRAERGGSRDRGPRGERRERGGRGERGTRGEREGRGEREPRSAREGRPSAGVRDTERRRSPAPLEPARSDERGEGRRAEGRMEAQPDDGSRRRRRSRRGGEAREGPPPNRVRESRGEGGRPSPAPEPVGSESGNGSLMPADELAATGRRLAEEFFQAMGFEAKVSAHAEGDSVEVRAEIAQDSELITGEKGEVRQAIQHLLNRMLNRGGSSRFHLQLEINDFWAQREEELRSLARRLADEAAAEGVEKLTEYLNAQERRVVHVALRDDTRVRTYGLGDGLIKKVAIAPEGAGGEEKTDS
jgi:spoIIIJ-associated protein